MTVKQIGSPSDAANEEIDLGKLLGVLLDARWFIVAVTFVFAVLGIAYALLATPIYKADALIQVEQKSSGVSSLVGDVGDIFASESSATTEIEILKSRMILGKTVDKLNLTTQITPVYFPLVGKGIARLTGSRHSAKVERFELPEFVDENRAFTLVVTDETDGKYQVLDGDDNLILKGVVGQLSKNNGYELFLSDLHAKNQDEFVLSKSTRLNQIAWLQSDLTVTERGKQTGILALSFLGGNPEEIEAIVNDISQNYFLQNVERNSAEAEKSLAFLKQNLPGIKDQLNASEDVLNQYRQKNESIDLGLEAQGTLKAMVEVESKLQDLTIKESEISQRFTKDHPSYKSLLDNRATLLKEKERIDKQVQKMPKTQREVLRMQRDVQVNQQIYIQLLNKVQELSILKAGTVGNVRILDDAQVSPIPVKPKKSLIVVIVALLGGVFSIAVTLVRAVFNRGVQSSEQIESIGLAVYATVPKSDLQPQLDLNARPESKSLRRKGKSRMLKSTTLQRTRKLSELLLAEANPADLSIEALRGLRTSLHFAMMEAKNNIVMISGPAPGIGKSFISANFAAVAAKTGQKVLLIDADMRKGYLQSHFGLQYDNGLSDILSSKALSEDAIKATGVENLDLVSRGAIPPNPSELLMHPRFKQFMEWAAENYDLVIIDTPPILAVTDAGIVGAIAGTSLMVGRFEQNTLKEIEVSFNRFDQVGVEIKGFILNAVEKKASSYYGGYGYYNYSYKSDAK